MVKLANRAKVSTSTTGTGTITLGSAVAGFQTFADAGVSNGETVRYVIEDGIYWELGYGIYTHSGTTLTRVVSESSNSDNALTLTGNASVFIAAVADDLNKVTADTFAEKHVSGQTNIAVKVVTKTSEHRYSGTGSSAGYTLDGTEAPYLELMAGKTYRFDQSDASNSGHPFRFYEEADKTTAYTTGVTTNGTAGSSGAYTQIAVTGTTKSLIYYQCSAHGYMGNQAIVKGITQSAAGSTNLTGLSDVTISSPSNTQVLKYNGSAWVNAADATGGGGGATVSISDTAPSSPSAGDQWYSSADLRMYIYYNDGSSSQWVQVGSGGSSSSGVAASAVQNLEKDVLHLALLRASDENKVAHTLNTAFVDVYQDESGVASKTGWSYNSTNESYATLGYSTGTAIDYSYTGANQTYAVPANVSSIAVKAWGAGGGNGYTKGGAGGYVAGTIPVTASSTLMLVVGGGGTAGVSGTTGTEAYGGGGQSGEGNPLHGGGGGGLAGVFADNTFTQAKALIIAGSGGGGGCCSGAADKEGGNGGPTGTHTSSNTLNGGGASVSAGGTAGASGNFSAGEAGSALQGGGHTGTISSGGGGSGYFGGGGGGSASSNMGAGGGGSNFIIGTATSTTNSGSAQGTVTPPNTSDSDYDSGIGVGATAHNTGGTVGGNAKVWLQPIVATLSATGEIIGNTQTSPVSVSSMGVVVMYKDVSGTATLNTDLKLLVSADNGSNYTEATLTAGANFSSSIKTASVGGVSVTAGTQIKYKIQAANQASGSKETHLEGVALQY